MFLVDSSGSIYRYNWPTVLNFMRRLVEDFTIGPDDVQVGVALFGNDVELQFHLNEYRYGHTQELKGITYRFCRKFVYGSCTVS